MLTSAVMMGRVLKISFPVGSPAGKNIRQGGLSVDRGVDTNANDCADDLCKS